MIINTAVIILPAYTPRMGIIYPQDNLRIAEAKNWLVRTACG